MEYLNSNINIAMNTSAYISNTVVNLSTATVNAIATYTFTFNFIYSHYSGDRIMLSLPSSIVLNAGFNCLSQTATVTTSCIQVQASPALLQITMTSSTPINQLIVGVSNLVNNWYVASSIITYTTTTNDTTLYYVEQGNTTLNFAAATLATTTATNQLIVLLSTSTIAVTVASPFSLNRATNSSLLYLLITIPT